MQVKSGLLTLDEVLEGSLDEPRDHKKHEGRRFYFMLMINIYMTPYVSLLLHDCSNVLLKYRCE